MWLPSICDWMSGGGRIPRFGLALLIGVSISVQGCDWIGEETIVSSSAGPTLWEESGRDPERTMIPVEWNLAWRHGGVEDTLLLRPLKLQGHDEGLYVLDLQAQRLLAFDREGGLEWTYGSPGEGPDEFQGVRDVRLGGGGDRVYLHDPEQGRITIVDDRGRSVRMISTRDVGHSQTLVPVGDSLFVLVTGAPEDPVVVLDLDGRVVRRMSLPWEGFADLPRLSRQGGAATDGDQWVYGFLLGNGFFGFEGLEPLPYTGRYVRHTEFPTVTVQRSGLRTRRVLAERPVCSGCSITLNDGVLYVLFGGGGSEHARIIDLYRWRDGEYLGSYEIPVSARVIHAYADRLYVMADVPYPEINALELPEPPPS